MKNFLGYVPLQCSVHSYCHAYFKETLEDPHYCIYSFYGLSKGLYGQRGAYTVAPSSSILLLVVFFLHIWLLQYVYHPPSELISRFKMDESICGVDVCPSVCCFCVLVILLWML